MNLNTNQTKQNNNTNFEASPHTDLTNLTTTNSELTNRRVTKTVEKQLYRLSIDDNTNVSTGVTDTDSDSVATSVSEASTVITAANVRSAAAGRTSAQAKKRNPSAKAYKKRRSAKFVLERLLKKGEANWNESDRTSASWAKAFLEDKSSQPASGGQSCEGSAGQSIMTRPLFQGSPSDKGRPSVDTKRSQPVTGRPSINIRRRSQLDSGGPSTSSGAKRDPASKRPRSQEDPSNTAKKAKKTTPVSRPFNEVAKDHLIFGIIDQGDDEGRISAENWRLLKAQMSSSILSHCLANPTVAPPTFKDGGWHQTGAKLLICSDESSADFIQSAISKVGAVWPGAKLKAVRKADIPTRPRARVWVPPGPSDPKDILQLMVVQNPDLPTYNWKVIKAEEPNDAGRLVSLLLNPESIEPLAARDFRIFYGLESLHLKVYERDEKLVSGLAEKPVDSSLLKLPEKQDGGDQSSDSEDCNTTVIEASVPISTNASVGTD